MAADVAEEATEEEAAGAMVAAAADTTSHHITRSHLVTITLMKLTDVSYIDRLTFIR